MRITFVLAALLGFIGAWPAAAQNSSASKIELVDAWARGSETKEYTTAYVEVINNANTNDSLIGVSSPWAERAYFAHLVHDGYDMKVKQVTSLKIKAKKRLKLSPSDYFIRLEKLTQDVRPGMAIPITLRFAQGGVVEAEAKVGNQLLGNIDR
jgi:copper(I)-binding protein